MLSPMSHPPTRVHAQSLVWQGGCPRSAHVGFITHVSILMKICFAAKKLARNVMAPVPRRAVAVRRTPSPFRLPSPCCSLPASPLGTCLVFPLVRLWFTQSAKAIQTESIWFCVCGNHSLAECAQQQGGDRLQLRESMYKHACVKASVPANPLLT